MSVKTIAVVLGDNDFSNTFLPLLATIMRAIEYHSGMTREEATSAILGGIEWHYRTFQNLKRGEPKRGVLGYLRGVQILFDDDANADVTKDRDGGAWYLCVATGDIYSY